MSIADKVAAEHLHWPGMEQCRCGTPIVEQGCGCNESTDAYTRHVAAEVEAAVRAQVAADIEAKRLASPTHLDGAYRYSARIASGGESR